MPGHTLSARANAGCNQNILLTWQALLVQFIDSITFHDVGYYPLNQDAWGKGMGD